MFILIVLFGISGYVTGAIEVQKVYNLMLVRENSSTYIESYWSNGADNDPDGMKYLQPALDIIQGGTFRSPLVDDWFLEPPNEVALLFTNLLGDIHDWLVFNTSDTWTEDLRAWVKPEKLIDTSFPSIATYPLNMTFGIPGYQFSLFRDGLPGGQSMAWLAIANRNKRDGNNTFPHFILPLVSGESFPMLSESETAGPPSSVVIYNRILLGYTVFKADVGAALGQTAVLINRMFASEFQNQTFTLEYSGLECSLNNRKLYMENTTHPRKFQTNVEMELQPLRVQCLWITFPNPTGAINLTLFAPNSSDVFIMLPVMIVKGFWYNESLPYGSSQARHFLDKAFDNFLEEPTTPTSIPSSLFTLSSTAKISTESSIAVTDSTTSLSVEHTNTISSSMTSQISISTTFHDTSISTGPATTTQGCTCSCNVVQTHNFDIEKRVEFLKHTLAVNKTSLSSYKRSHCSADDSRRSASYLGYLGGLVIFLAIFLIVCSDIVPLFKYTRYVCKNYSKRDTYIRR